MSDNSQLHKVLIELKEKLKEIHNISHGLIYNRVDIEEPLSKQAKNRIAELDEWHINVMKKIQSSLLQLKLINEIKEGTRYPELTLVEFKVLELLRSTKKDFLSVPNFQSNLQKKDIKMSRSTLTNHLRKLLVGNLVITHEYKYQITKHGLETLSYNEDIRRVSNAFHRSRSN